MKYLCFAVLTFLVLVSVLPAQDADYLQEWNKFKTKLIRKEKSFQKAPEFEPRKGDVETVAYDSEGLRLKGLLNRAAAGKGERKPAVVYLHGGFALGYGQMERTKPFTDSGFVVFAPTWRGENGNPGYFEAFLGEVRDAKAAVRWLGRQDYVDPERIYVFGWSVGGGIALNLSLHGDIPVRMQASSAGIYDLGLIKSWATEDDYIKFPYDYKSKRENYFRLPVYNLRKMVRPHITYIGKEDGFSEAKALVDGLYRPGETKFTLIELPGDHDSSVETAIRRFIEEIKEQDDTKTSVDRE
jgi:acetyl esterase/lipase